MSIDERKIIDCLLERPYIVEVDGQRLSLYPPSLGVSLMAESELPIGVPKSNESEAIAIMLSTGYPEEVARYIALHTCRTKDEAQDEDRIASIVTQISKIKSDELTSLFLLVRGRSDVSEITSTLGIDDNLLERKRALDRRGRDDWESFGGLSIYGGLIDPLAERYGWTLEYILWGISYANIQLLLSDQPTSLYKQSGGDNHINADDPSQQADIDRIFG